MKLGKLLASAVLGVSALASSAAFAGDQDFSLVNKTGSTIASIMVSPHDQKNWGPDILGRDVLDCDQTVDIKFHPDADAEYWDLKVVDKEGHEIVWSNLDLLKISKLTIHLEDDKATADIE
jgi:hypothetical protein